MRLHHVGLVCSSQENADKFYEDILGLEKMKTSELTPDFNQLIFQHAQRCQMILYGNDRIALEVFVPDEFPERRITFEHICIEVSEREAFLERCHDSGLDVRRIPRGDTFLAFVADFDKNLFEVKEAG